MQSRLDRLFSLTQVTSNTELGDKTHAIQSHLSMASNSLVDELQVLTEELAERLTLWVYLKKSLVIARFTLKTERSRVIRVTKRVT